MSKRTRDELDPEPAHTYLSPSSPLSSTTQCRPGVTLLNDADDDASASKAPHLDYEVQLEVMRCSLPPHRQPISFASFEEYDIHYAKMHVNRCIECRRNFPTAHFLSVHQEENHDPLVAVRRERGEKTYSCFVEDCERKCSTPQKRRMHLMDKHMFPKDYDFYIINSGIDHKGSMLRSGRHRRKSSAAERAKESSKRGSVTAIGDSILDQDNTSWPAEEQMLVDTKDEKPDVAHDAKESRDHDVNELTGAMSALRFIPTSVRFGRGRGRGFSRN